MSPDDASSVEAAQGKVLPSPPTHPAQEGSGFSDWQVWEEAGTLGPAVLSSEEEMCSHRLREMAPYVWDSLSACVVKAAGVLYLALTLSCLQPSL